MTNSPKGSELTIPEPTKTVEFAASLLEPQSTILDLGAGVGRNGHYLAQLGHRVRSVEIDPLQIKEGQRIAKLLGSSAINHTFIKADMRKVDLNERYDAVISTFSLQDVLKVEALEILGWMHRVVKPEGLNILDTYIASQQQQYEKQNYALFSEGELKSIYENSGWEIMYYETTGVRPTSIVWDSQNRVNKSWLQSQEGLVARETKIATTKRLLIARAENAKNTNPEYAEELQRIADSL